MENGQYMSRLGSARFVVVFALVVLLGAVFRFTALDAKVLHGDEANQAVKAAHLLETGDYQYDPHEHHGPTLYYLTLPVFWASGTAGLVDSVAWQYRVVPALFGVLTIALLWGLREVLGRAGTLWAALFTAVSHAMVYYSRYYIQEMLFVCFALAALVAAWRYVKSPTVARAVLLGAALGLLQATKETSVLLYGAAGAAGALTWLWRRVETGTWGDLSHFLRPATLLAGIVSGFCVCLVLYTSFFTHPRGIVDAVMTYSRYFSRAEGLGSAAMHDKPFLYYLELLFFTYREPGPRWTEAFALIMAAVGALVALSGRLKRESATDTASAARYLLRFLALYALILLLGFSLVPYKTPWNLLPFWQPILVLSGVGVGWLTTQFGTPLLRGALCLACAVPLAHAGRQAYQGAFTYPADTRNPYVYAHTSTAVMRLVERVEQIAAVHPRGKDLVIAVIGEGGDYWPLPWYLRSYPNIGYWNTPPETMPDADILVTSARFGPDFMEKLGEAYHAETGALRPGAMLAIFIKSEWWEKFMAPRR